MELAIAGAAFGAGWIACWALQTRPIISKLIHMKRLGFTEIVEGPVREEEAWEYIRED